jgi:tetratricopeptide (TPR) repeat protein
MRKFLLFFLLLFLPNLIFATSFEEGKALFQAKKYEAAYAIFKQLVRDDSSNIELNFYLGRSAFEVRDFDMSVIAFERNLILDERHARSHLELARTFFILKRYDEAKIAFLTILALKPPQSVQQKIKAYLGKMEETKEKDIVRGLVSIGVERDDNIKNNSTITDVVGGLTSQIDIVQATALKKVVALKHQRSHEDLTYTNQLFVYDKRFNNHSDANILYLLGKSAVQKKRFGLSLDYDRLWYGNRLLMDSIALSPSYVKPIDANTMVQTTATYKKKFHKQNRNRDANQYTLNLSLFKSINNNRISVGAKYRKEDRLNNGDDPYVNQSQREFKVQYQTEVKRLPITLSAQNTRYRFEKNSRKDNYRNLALAITQPINEQLAIEFTGSYTKNSSTENLYKYTKRTYGIAMNWSF